MPKKIKKNVEKILAGGIALRARQQDAIQALDGINNNEKNGRNSPDALYQIFYSNLIYLEKITKAYPCETSVEIYNHVIECIEIYHQKDNPRFKGLSKRTVEDFTN